MGWGVQQIMRPGHQVPLDSPALRNQKQQWKVVMTESPAETDDSRACHANRLNKSQQQAERVTPTRCVYKRAWRARGHIAPKLLRMILISRMRVRTQLYKPFLAHRKHIKVV